jgi:hypothetical protein
VLPADANQTCVCGLQPLPCFDCPESPILTGLLLCKLDPTGFLSLPLDSDEIEQALLDVPVTVPPRYQLFYAGLQAPEALGSNVIGVLDCFCMWSPLGTVATTTTRTTPPTSTSQTTTLASSTSFASPTTQATDTSASSVSSTTTTTSSSSSSSTQSSTSTESSTSTSTFQTTSAPATSTVAPTTTPTPPTLAPEMACSGSGGFCTGTCQLTGFDCVSVDGVCGCRLPCSEQSVLACELGYCSLTGHACGRNENGTACACNPVADSNLELLAVIGVPTLITFLLLAAFYTQNENKAGMKHKYQ